MSNLGPLGPLVNIVCVFLQTVVLTRGKMTQQEVSREVDSHSKLIRSKVSYCRNSFEPVHEILVLMVYARSESKKVGKDQESKQSSTTPDPGYQC